MTAEAPIRIASEFAGYPFRMLAQTAPIKWGDGGAEIVLAQQKINIDLAEALLSNQAPVVYADDLLTLAQVEDDVRVDLNAIADIPTAMPAFDRMFVEVNMRPLVDRSKTASKDIYSFAGYVVSDPFPHEQAEALREFILIHAMKGKALDHAETLREHVDDDKQGQIDGVIDQLVNQIRVPTSIFRSGNIDEASIDTIKTAKFVAIYPYICAKGPRGKSSRSEVQCVGPVGMVIYMVDPNKGLVRLKGGEPWQIYYNPSDASEENIYYEKHAQFYDDCSRTAAALSMRVMALLNCSNVQLVDQGKTTDGMQKREIKQRGLKSLRYHELRVKVGEHMLPVYGRKGLTGEKGLSIVRGHFRDYSKGKGLFGSLKYPAVWVPPHARGNAQNGIVMKDYALVSGSNDIQD